MQVVQPGVVRHWIGGGDHALGKLGPQNLVPALSLFCRNASTDNGSNILCTECTMLSWIASEWVAEDGRFRLLW